MPSGTVVAWPRLKRLLAGLTAFGIVRVLVHLYGRYRILSRMARQTKGPEAHWLIGTLAPLLENIERVHDWRADLAQKYGNWMWTPMIDCQMGEITTCKPENVQFILKDEFDNFVKVGFEIGSNAFNLSR
jgi:hypothetical protein